MWVMGCVMAEEDFLVLFGVWFGGSLFGSLVGSVVKDVGSECCAVCL